ncbi:MAG: hypothetical protein CMJ84_12550 [Planctomycetes bacterium]|jgi:hypothetical protein|nr:hypothetical protein [Planctomycetota bacterium]MDP6409471.1 hypothetical protein [Planctomycetota bacterium]
MPPTFLYKLGKLLEGLGLLVILVGLSMSIGVGLEDDGLASMAAEFQGLMVGGALFALGYLLERGAGGR